MTVEEMELVIAQLANIGIEVYLGKDIKSHMDVIQVNLNKVNMFIDDYVENDSELYHYWVDVAYQYYRYRDKILYS